MIYSLRLSMLSTDGNWFIDKYGRRILLRGVNLSGSTKIPYPDGVTHVRTDFSNHRNVSFVGRPFPLDEAHEHFERLHHWGFNCIRLLTTWEAIEHAGPEKYDTKYLDYFTKIVEIAGEFGFYVFIDPHQDVWSRMSGGDGAPGWTFEKVGLDLTKFGESGAARVMQYNYPDDYKPMEWTFNHGRYATATMFTLFFGGRQFAPNLVIDNKNIQDYLQDHFINSMLQVAKRVKDMEHVIGFDSLNEPDAGLIGLENLGEYLKLKVPGINPKPIDVLIAGDGHPRKVPTYKLKWYGVRPVGTEILNPKGISNWFDDRNDIWQEHGIWTSDNGEPKLLEPEYFKYNKNGAPVDFFRDYLRPFIKKYIKRMREIRPDAIIFIEGEPLHPTITWGDNDPKNVVNATHWYDGLFLFTKKYRSWITFDVRKKAFVLLPYFVKRNFEERLNFRKKVSQQIHGGIPTLIGEFGIPFDMNKKKSYETGDFTNHEEALSIYYGIMDKLQLHSTLWNYTPDNNNEYGDLWNLEDFSIFSRDQKDLHSGINSGGRAIKGYSRPFPHKISGDPNYWKFNKKSKEFIVSFFNDVSINAETIIYIPPIHYPHGYSVESNTNISIKTNDNFVFITSEVEGEITIRITKK